jgi:hypothetical protein
LVSGFIAGSLSTPDRNKLKILRRELVEERLVVALR